MRRYLILRRHLVRKPRLVIAEAERAGLHLNHALASLEMETGIPQRNIFGCDYGPGKAFCHKRVTARRVKALLAGPYQNGVGWTQLTYRPFVQQAQKMGGAHKPRYQMRVGFNLLAGLIRTYGISAGFARYNGSGPAAEAYGRQAAALAREWHRRLR